MHQQPAPVLDVSPTSPIDPVQNREVVITPQQPAPVLEASPTSPTDPVQNREVVVIPQQPAPVLDSAPMPPSDPLQNGAVTTERISSNPLLDRAAKCGDVKECISMMVEAIHPRSLEAISVAAARLGEMSNATRGDRKMARALNDQGLASLRAKEFDAAIEFFKKAFDADPVDVEIAANYGYAAIGGKRYEVAVLGLSNALLLDPRRTSTWIPVAELYAARGNRDKAMRALLLAYEFSKNKEKTWIWFQEKALNDENESMRASYTATLEILLNNLDG